MRLEPVERPKGLLLKVAYWMGRRQFGAVPSSLKVVYARAPKLASTSYRIVRAMESRTSLDPELRLLVMTQSSLLNGCSFCADLHRAQAVQARIGLEKFRALADFAASSIFSARECAALAYTEEATRRREVCDETFERLREHFDEQEIVELTWLNAIGNFFNLIAVPLQLESDDLTALALAQAGAAREAS